MQGIATNTTRTDLSLIRVIHVNPRLSCEVPITRDLAIYMIGFHVLHSPTVTGAPTEPARQRMTASVVEQ
jgi:hypothetical protein